MRVWRCMIMGGVVCALGCSGVSDDFAATAAGDAPDGPDEPGADPQSDSDVDPEALAECVPSQDAFDANIRPIFETRCGTCHGQAPDFGAPFSLLDYDGLVAGEPGSRPVDGIVAALGSGRMPPAGNTPPTHAEFDAMVLWSSCGLQHPDYADGLEASAPVFEAPEEPPAGSTPVDLTADSFSVGIDDIDLYQNFHFDNVVDEEGFITRIDGIVDESRVVHHITLHYANSDDTNYLYAWAPGTGAVQFPDGGLRIRPGDRFRIEIHYNNGAGIEDAVDSSGVRLWIGPPEGTEYGMADPASWQIFVPPLSQAVANSTCVANQDFRILAGMPHMHEVGSEFRHVLERTDGTRETMISLTGWSFELQYFYSMPFDVRAGDQLHLTCVYDNPGDTAVTAGLGTKDEMCFDFLYVTPPRAMDNCSTPF